MIILAFKRFLQAVVNFTKKKSTFQFIFIKKRNNQIRKKVLIAKYINICTILYYRGKK